MHLQLTDIYNFEFQHIELNRSETDNFYYILCCRNDQEDVALDDTKGLIKRFKSVDTAIKVIEKIFDNNVVLDSFIRVKVKTTE